MIKNYHPNAAWVGDLTPDELIAGGFDCTPKSVKLKAGTAYLRGMILQEFAAGIYEQCTAVENALYILAEDIDLSESESDSESVAYMTGEFNARALILGETINIDELTQKFETRGIFLRKSVGIIQGYANG